MPAIGHFPMSENHEVFRTYLIQALQLLQDKREKKSVSA
jgi:hypothetical protein